MAVTLHTDLGDIVYGYLTPNRSRADFKILTSWKVFFDGEHQHTSIWGISKIFDFFEKKILTVFYKGGPYENRGFEKFLADFST